mgnify:CR=1 FL=1
MRHLSLLLFISTVYTAKIFIKIKSSNTKRLNYKFFVAEDFRTKTKVWAPIALLIAILLQNAAAAALRG